MAAGIVNSITAPKLSIVQSILDSIDDDGAEETSHSIFDINSEILKFLSEKSDFLNSEQSFALESVQVTLSKRLAGHDMFENAVKMIERVNNQPITTDISNSDLLSSDEAANKPDDQGESVIIIEDVDGSGVYDDLYGDIEQVDDMYGDIADETNISNEDLNTNLNKDITIASDDATHYLKKFDDGNLPKPCTHYSVPYFFQDTSGERLAVISRAVKGQRSSSLCIRAVPMLTKKFAAIK